MSNFINIVSELLFDQGKTTQNLFNDSIISKNTFYKYKNRTPNLHTLIKIANYLHTNIDYMFEISLENNFTPYLEKQDFYKKLNDFLNMSNISQRKFCADLGIARANLTRWKNGICPNVNTILQIVNYLKCSTDDLLVREQNNWYFYQLFFHFIIYCQLVPYNL